MAVLSEVHNSLKKFDLEDPISFWSNLQRTALLQRKQHLTGCRSKSLRTTFLRVKTLGIIFIFGWLSLKTFCSTGDLNVDYVTLIFQMHLEIIASALSRPVPWGHQMHSGVARSHEKWKFRSWSYRKWLPSYVMRFSSNIILEVIVSPKLRVITFDASQTFGFDFLEAWMDLYSTAIQWHVWLFL